MKGIIKKNSQLDSLFFIGDVHGQNNKLELLLADAGFDTGDIENSSYRSSRLVFLGDLIDNKPDHGADHLSTLGHVKSLVEQGLAYCVMGNHEFNAIGWSIQKQDGSYCRCHDKPGNITQHQLFLEQVGENSDEHTKWVQWFKTLPLFLDFDTVRCIHACWDQAAIDRLKNYLNPDNTLKEEHWLDAFNPGHELYTLCETLLKGPELALPDGYFFNDKNDVKRHHLRVAWWKPDALTYRDIGIVQPKERERIPNLPLPSQQQAKAMDVPVVVGHYTLPSPPDSLPKPLSAKVVCVDYNAASQEGKLVGYWMELDASNEDEFPRVTERQFCYPDAPTHESYIDDGVYELLKAFVNSLPEVKHPDPQQEDSFCRHLSEVLYSDWDPIGVAGDEDLRDEYYSYEPDVIKLAKTGKAEALSAYLFLTHTVTIGMSENADTRLKCQRIGHELIQHWCTLNEVTA